MRFILLLLLFSSTLSAQESIQLDFKWLWANYDLGQNIEHQIILNEQELKITKASCYISNIHFYFLGNCVGKYPDQYFLLDIQNSNSNHFLLDISADNFDSIAFTIGIDSTTHYNGAMDGVLDPLKGMYWTWQSGYIFIKLEGTAEYIPSRKHKFQHHIGGFEGANKALERVGFRVNYKNLSFGIDLNKYFQSIDLIHNHTVMRPSLQAIELAKFFSSSFIRMK